MFVLFNTISIVENLDVQQMQVEYNYSTIKCLYPPLTVFYNV